MSGLGTLVNSGAIILGSLIGLFLKRGLPEKWQQTIMSSIALCVFVIGVQMAMQTGNMIIVIISLVLGSIIGEIINIEERMNNLGVLLGQHLAKGSSSIAGQIAEGFVNSSILFCTGAMAIVGSIQDGLAGDCATLFAKSTLDGIVALLLTANVGVGVMLSAVSVGVY
ncbi:membrane protein containing DUF554, partial [gut metagenome]